MAPSRSLLLVAALALALAGCGTGDDRDQARAAVERLYAALDQDDGEAACHELSTAARLALASQDGRPCSRAITALDLQGGSVTSSVVYIVNARVVLAGGETAFLGRAPDGWKVTAFGCRERGESRDRPMDCEAES